MKFEFLDLDVYQFAKDLAVDVYKLTDEFPPEEKFTLAQQMNRAAMSVSYNIAECQSKENSKEKSDYFNSAYSSLIELICHYEIARNLNYIPIDQSELFFTKAQNLAEKMSDFKKAAEKNKGNENIVPIRRQ